MDILKFAEKLLTPLKIKLTEKQKSILVKFYHNTLWNPVERADNTGEGMTTRDQNDYYNTLYLIMGRRSGKDLLISIIALYEFYKLLYGEPYASSVYSSLRNANVLLFSPSKVQAEILFKTIKELLLNSVFYKSVDFKITSNTISYSGVDGITSKSLIIMHNIDKAVGVAMHTCIVSEAALFTDDQLQRINYNIPTIKLYNDSLNPGKMIYSSSPRSKNSLFYKLYSDNNINGHTLKINMPTWVARPEYTKSQLQKLESTLSEEKFQMEYGAEFSDVNFYETEQITFRIPSYMVELFKKIARERSYKEDRDIIYTDIIRDILINSLNEG